jgi:arsenate reductase
MLARRLLAEFIGNVLLLATIIGSGIMAQRLSPGDVGLELLEVDFATACALVAIILVIGPVSGAHLNPVVSLVDRLFGGLTTKLVILYAIAQVLGSIVGTVVANLMFSRPAVEFSTTARSGGGLWLAEVVATFGLVLVAFGVVRSGRASLAPFAVAAYIGAAFYFTASTSFANPAVTIGRMLSNSFAGIEPASGPAFMAAQLVGGLLAVLAVKTLYPTIAEAGGKVVSRSQT